jgi:hypothetical protein
MEINYQYTKPKGIQTFLTGKELIQLFPNKTSYKHAYVEVYVTENQITLHYFLRNYAKVINILYYPIVILLNGISNIKNVNRDYRRMFNEKETGAFSSDIIYNKLDVDDSHYSKILHSLVNKNRIQLNDI